jgi:menaquinone-dependent protoporphyrinogen oxidase
VAKKVLLVYSTRYGATASTAVEIARVLKDEGLEVKVADLKKEKIKDIAPYDLVIVGGGMQMGKWTGEPEAFLGRFQKELANKKVAIFISSAAQSLLEHDKKTEEMEKNLKYLAERASKYNLKPVATTIHGGVWDFNKMNFLFRKTLAGSIKPQLKAAGLKEVQPELYDTRDWNIIRNWAKELAGKI